jgi:hypothetical protein
MGERAVTGNAASAPQVRAADKQEKRRINHEVEEFRLLLENPGFRRYLWRLMGHCKVFETVFDGHGSKMAYNAGMQDVGHFILAEIQDARPTALIQMMEEAKQREEAAHGTG